MLKKILFLLGILGFTSQNLQAADSVEPIKALTPGSVMVDKFTGNPMKVEQICQRGYATANRKVEVATKRLVYQEYGIRYVSRTHEVDHLISLELGGSNEGPYLLDQFGNVRSDSSGRPLRNPLSNLWPQSYSGEWNARVKDTLENKMHELVCSGRLPLVEAQQEIASDWVGAYRRYVGATPIEFRTEENNTERSYYPHHYYRRRLGL